MPENERDSWIEHLHDVLESIREDSNGGVRSDEVQHWPATCDEPSQHEQFVLGFGDDRVAIRMPTMLCLLTDEEIQAWINLHPPPLCSPEEAEQKLEECGNEQ